MEGLYQNPPLRWAGKYRVKSARLEGWDYGADAYYFITICTHECAHYFGNVMVDDGGAASVALSNVGNIARDCWLDIPNHFSNASLDEWVIMPNHVHGIVVIGGNDVKTFCRDEALPRLYKTRVNIHKCPKYHPNQNHCP